jgi:hypothetical protein
MSGSDEYRFDGDSDEEKGLSEKQKAPKIVTIEDLEVLKVQTTDLLDPSWKISRNKKLLNKMLELDEPMITDKVSILSRVHVHLLIAFTRCQVALHHLALCAQFGFYL